MSMVLNVILNKFRNIAPLTVFSLLLLSITVFAQDADIDGAKDHPVTGRYQGSYIKVYEQKEYEEVRFLKPPLDVAGNYNAVLTDAFTIPLSGRSTTIVYVGPKNRSITEVLVNYISRLSAGGYKVISKCRGGECGLGGADVYIQRLYLRGIRTAKIPSTSINSAGNDVTVYALLQKQSPSGDIWVSMYGSEYNRGGAMTPNIMVSVLETKPMETGNMTFVDAVSMQEALDKMGRVALYGIYFDSDKSEVKPD